MADRSVNVRLRLDIAQFERGAAKAAAVTQGLAQSLDTADSHTARFTQTLLALAPAAVPLGGAIVPAIAGITVGLGAAAAAAGVTVLAFQGVGDAVKALNDYQLEPTRENLVKLHEAMQTLGPAGRDFARSLQDLRPELQQLQNLGQAGLFPGLEDSIDELMKNGPLVGRFITDISTTLGDLAAQGGDRLNDKDWREFFRFLDAEAGPTLTAFAKASGNVVEGLTNIIMAADPLSDMFTQGLLDASRDFKDFTENLDESAGFQGFVDYIQENGPEAMETVGALAEALAAVVQAAAPVGSLALPVIKTLAEILKDVAESPVGPVLIGAAAGLSAVSRAVALFKAANGSALVSMFSGVKKEAAGVEAQTKAAGSGLAVFNEKAEKFKTGLKVAGATAGILALSMTDLDDKAGLTNTTMLAMAGSMAGPWGAAAGTAVGLTLDLAAANDDLETAMKRVDDAMASGNVAQIRTSLQGLQDDLDATKEKADFSEAFSSGHMLQGQVLWDVARAGFLKLTDSVEQAESKVEEAKNRIASGRSLGELMTSGLGGITSGFASAKEAVEAFEASFRHLNNILADKSTLLDYEQALDDLRASINAPGDKSKNFLPGFERGREQLRGVIDLFQTAIDRSSKLAEHGRELDAQHMLTRAISDLKGFREQYPKIKGFTDDILAELERLDKKYATPTIDADPTPAQHKITETSSRLQRLRVMETVPTIDANPAPAKGKVDGVRGLLRELTGERAVPKIDADPSGARSGAAAAQAAINAVHGSTVYIDVYRRLHGAPGNLPPAPAGADGMTVPGQRHPYGDKILAYLAPGEEVISNRHGQADAFRADRAAGRIPGYADGTSSGQSWSRRHGPRHDGHDEANHAAHNFAKRLKEAQKELDKETEKRRDLRAEMNQFKASVRDSFNNDPFGNGLAGFNLQLTADRDDAIAMKKALARAKKRGLDGGLFAALAASGDLTTAQQFAGLSKAQIGKEEKLFAAAQHARGDLAGFAGKNSPIGEAMRDNAKAMRELRREIKDLRKHVGKDVEKGARAGVGDRDRRTASRSRTR